MQCRKNIAIEITKFITESLFVLGYAWPNIARPVMKEKWGWFWGDHFIAGNSKSLFLIPTIQYYHAYCMILCDRI